MDVAIADGKIARVAENIPAAAARTVANVAGLYVTPGLVDIHVHVYTGTALRARPHGRMPTCRRMRSRFEAA